MAPSGLGFTYSQTTTDDFIIRVPLESGQGDEDLNSQKSVELVLQLIEFMLSVQTRRKILETRFRD